jgi:hypothetical protein
MKGSELNSQKINDMDEIKVIRNKTSFDAISGYVENRLQEQDEKKIEQTTEKLPK